MDVGLPPVFDQVLSYLAEALPQPLYSFLLNALSLTFTLASALFDLLAPLLSTNPSEWDLQTVLPPIITVLSAYLALTSLYRTASWMIRTTFWFIKWGIILGTLVAAASWYLGATQGHVGAPTHSNIVSQLASFALDKMNGQNRNAVGGERMNHIPPVKRVGKRPKPWDTFDQHREWQYTADQPEPRENSDIDIVMENLLDVAGQMLGGFWWSDLKRGGPPSSTQNAKEDKRSKISSR